MCLPDLQSQAGVNDGLRSISSEINDGFVTSELIFTLQVSCKTPSIPVPYQYVVRSLLLRLALSNSTKTGDLY